MIDFEVKSKKQHISVNIRDRPNQQLQSIKDNYKAFDQPYNGKDNNDYVNGKDPYIYIQTRNGNVILSDYNFGNYKSGGLRKMMRIVYYYAKKQEQPNMPQQ